MLTTECPRPSWNLSSRTGALRIPRLTYSGPRPTWALLEAMRRSRSRLEPRTTVSLPYLGRVGPWRL